MWYTASILSLLVLIALFSVTGLAIMDLCLPPRIKPAAAEFLAPTLGLTVFLVPINLFGWLGSGFHGWISLTLTATIGVVALRLVRVRDEIQCRTYQLRLMSFAALASFPMLGQILWYNTFNPFNDAWMYIYQAQWLQRHGFDQAALVAGHHPAAAAVLGFQYSGLRIAPSMLLGWIQATFGMDWSYEVYPTTASLALVCGAMAVGGIVRAAFPSRRQEAWWVALAVALSMNGFAFGVNNGFLPQTLGLTFGMAALALRGMELSLPPNSVEGVHQPPLRGWLSDLTQYLPLSMCVASVTYCYPEILPFLLPALSLSYVFPWPRSLADWEKRLKAVGTVAITFALLSSFEAGRVIRALRMQAHVVSGNPVAWSPGGFLAHSLGLKAGIYEGSGWFFQNGWRTLPGAAIAIAVFGLLLRLSRTGRSHIAPQARPLERAGAWKLVLLPSMLMAGFCAIAFLYFRYFTSNPWPGGLGPWAPGTGQSWSQYKLSLWASPVMIALTACAFIRLTDLLGRKRGSGAFLWIILASWCMIGLGWNSSMLLARASPIRTVSGDTQDPFGSYRAFCEPLTQLQQSDVIFLEATAGDYGSIKQRELLAYFLGDRQIIGDWTLDDNLPQARIPPAERKLPPDAADWIVRYNPDYKAGMGKTAPELCRLTTTRVKHGDWTLDSVSSGYDRETDASGRWFYWTQKDLFMVWHKVDDESSDLPTAPMKRVKLQFDEHTFTTPQTLTVKIVGTTLGDQTFEVQAGPENRRFESEAFIASSNEVQVRFTGSGEARTVSETDTRKLSYQVGAAMLKPVP